jgi:Flp pilus assembly protein TadG
MRRCRGSTMVEGAIVITSFVLLMLGVMDIGRLGFAYNSVTYAAHRAARLASTHGSSSGLSWSLADITSNVQSNVVALDTAGLSVDNGVNPWPDGNNSPGSHVKVVVSYSFQPLLIPISSTSVTLSSTVVEVITQ